MNITIWYIDGSTDHYTGDYAVLDSVVEIRHFPPDSTQGIDVFIPIHNIRKIVAAVARDDQT